MPRRRPVRDAATEVEAAAIDFREFMAELRTDGIELSLDLPGVLGGVTDKIKVRVKLGSDEPKEGE